MRKLWLGSVAALALIVGGAAQAADMPAAPIVKAPPPPVIDWGGFYLGGHAGYAASDVRFNFTDDVPNSENLHFAPSSFIGGIQFGAQWQFDQWIMGVEGTWSGLDMQRTVASTVTAGEVHSIKIDETATATIRLGATWQQMLFYAKAGYAAARMNIHSVDPNPVPALTADDTRWRSGWTAGAGAEYMVFPSVVVGAEFDYYNFNFDNTGGLYNDGVTPYGVGQSNGNIYAVMGRLSYLFR
jgi:outer membrane immunogenic protein